MRTLFCPVLTLALCAACAPAPPHEPKSALVAVGDTVWRIQKPGRPSVWDETNPVGGLRQARAIYLDELEGLPLVTASVSIPGKEVSTARSQIDYANIKPVLDGSWLRYDLYSRSIYFQVNQTPGNSFDIVSCGKGELKDMSGISLGRKCSGFANYTKASRLEVMFYEKSWRMSQWRELTSTVENRLSKYRENVEGNQ